VENIELACVQPIRGWIDGSLRHNRDVEHSSVGMIVNGFGKRGSSLNLGLAGRVVMRIGGRVSWEVTLSGLSCVPPSLDHPE
jgi:hypothetical protein